MAGLFDKSGSIRDWIPLRTSGVENELQRVMEIHASKDLKNMRMQQSLANKRELSKMTSPLMVRENQNINIFRRVGKSNINPAIKPSAKFFHRNNLLEMPLRRQNVLNIPYVHKPIRPGRINARIFQNSLPKSQNVLNDPLKRKISF